MFETEEFKLQERRGVAPAGNDPSLPSTAPKTYPAKNLSEDFGVTKRKFLEKIYDRDKKTYCGRTCKSWVYIVGYGLIYLMFLTTFTLVLLYLSLFIMKEIIDFKHFEPMALVYPESGVGLSATPVSEDSYPLIYYKYGDKNGIDKYVQAINRLLLRDKFKGDLGYLGPCGRPPFGYGDKPCVIVRINKELHWTGVPLQLNSTVTKIAPPEVRKWMMIDKNRLWLKCSGYYAYDKEHIGSIKYFPDPPGFDPNLYSESSSNNNNKYHLVAIQITNFTLGISLAIECKLWYENGPSTIDFVLYVTPNDTTEQASVNV